MLEIFILFRLGKSISEKAKAKGRSSVGYVLLLIGLWFGGEICGAIAGAIAFEALDGGNDDAATLFCIVGALIGAIIGAVTAFAIVGNLSDLSRNRYDEDDYYEDDYRDQDRERSRSHERNRDRDDDDYDRDHDYEDDDRERRRKRERDWN